ncbi:biotin transporter BioY [candidate division KSB1 bacterium]|nr:MAG: biotin transporter BioY [candidate division KSB1 bacterium]
MTLVEALAPRRANSTVWWIYQVVAVLTGSLLIALSAQISFRLPFSPVPITGQTFGVLLIAALLGRIRGTAAVMTYLGEGICGLPVFAGGACGAFHLLGPTGGFLVSFIPAAFLVGFLAELGWDRSYIFSGLAMLIGSLVVLTMGATWLSLFVGWNNAWQMGFFPFIIGDVVKISAAIFVLPSLRRLIR